jgi:hypothetical protein
MKQPPELAPHYTTTSEIAEWIESLREQGFRKMELKPDKGGATIKNWPKVPEGAEVSKAAEIALARAQNRGHSARGALACFTLEATGPDELRDSCEIVVPGGWAAGNEAPDMDPAERFTRDLTRSFLDLHRILISSDDTRSRANEKLIENMSAQLDAHDKRRVSIFDLWERVQGKQMERDLMLKDAERADENAKWGRNKLDLVIPVAMNRLAGGGPGKGTPYFGEEMVKAFLKSLSPEKCAKIMEGGVLEPEQAAVFAELYLAYAEAEKKEEARKINEHETNGHTNGAGAAGRKPINNAAPKGD